MINHRKLYPDDKTITIPCPDICDSTCPYGCDGPYPYVDIDPIPIPSPPPPPQTSPPISAKHSEHVSPFVIVIVTLFASCFFVIICYLIAVKFLSRWNVFRPPQRRPEATNEEFVDEERGLTAIDHPIWYINTTGLQQSVISSITIFRYKKGDHFIESTVCAVCLNEFRNDDALRLLPKCSHAFHIHCIDTWLRSHVNCPVCRAAIVSSVATSAPVASNALNFNNLSRNEDSQVENRGNGEGLNINQAREDETGEIIEVQQEDHGGQDVGIVKKTIFPRESSASWVIEDLNDEGKMMMNGGNNKRQSVRRSVSVDSLSECEDSSVSDDQIAGVDRDSSNNVGANSTTLRIITGGSSVAQFLHKKPVRMKRSFSYSDRSFSTQHSRNNSAHPLSYPSIS